MAAGLLAAWTATAGAVEGVVSLDSPYSVAETADRLIQALQPRGLDLVGRIDQTAEARKAGIELPPRQLVLFSDPKVAGALIRCQPTLGLELPQKALVWEDVAGKVRLSYTDPETVAVRYGVGDCGEAMTQLQAAWNDLTLAATSQEPATLSANDPSRPGASASTAGQDR